MPSSLATFATSPGGAATRPRSPAAGTGVRPPAGRPAGGRDPCSASRTPRPAGHWLALDAGATRRGTALSQNARRTVEIVNRLGLHARPAMAFVDLAATFQC
ncbi:MAG: HPr family phosphocarrier protein, partial [Planctomycetaceae bacterium]|nr:HPr family phosphocarrier protein [Planctomycetaceae bacterium]